MLSNTPPSNTRIDYPPFTKFDLKKINSDYCSVTSQNNIKKMLKIDNNGTPYIFSNKKFINKMNNLMREVCNYYHVPFRYYEIGKNTNIFIYYINKEFLFNCGYRKSSSTVSISKEIEYECKFLQEKLPYISNLHYFQRFIMHIHVVYVVYEEIKYIPMSSHSFLNKKTLYNINNDIKTMRNCIKNSKR